MSHNVEAARISLLSANVEFRGDSMITFYSRVLRLPAVQSLTGLGRDSIYRLSKDGSPAAFPKPFKISQRASGWYEHEVLAYLEERAALRSGGSK